MVQFSHFIIVCILLFLLMQPFLQTCIYTLEKQNKLLKQNNLKIMKKLLKTFALVCISTVLAFANLTPQPKTFAVGMYNVANSLTLKVFVQKLRGDNLKLTLKDTNGDVIMTAYSAKKSVREGFMFDLKNLEEGQYTLVVGNGEETFEKAINLVKKVAVENKLEI